ncbi:MAG: hypothetical protein HY986_07650 [Candidatus Melainabacteria bacterium]|nr:hypothetical protein [Candidatus Melainabacteria bacterium]
MNSEQFLVPEANWENFVSHHTGAWSGRSAVFVPSNSHLEATPLKRKFVIDASGAKFNLDAYRLSASVILTKPLQLERESHCTASGIGMPEGQFNEPVLDQIVGVFLDAGCGLWLMPDISVNAGLIDFWFLIEPGVRLQLSVLYGAKYKLTSIGAIKETCKERSSFWRGAPLGVDLGLPCGTYSGNLTVVDSKMRLSNISGFAFDAGALIFETDRTGFVFDDDAFVIAPNLLHSIQTQVVEAMYQVSSELLLYARCRYDELGRFQDFSSGLLRRHRETALKFFSAAQTRSFVCEPELAVCR